MFNPVHFYTAWQPTFIYIPNFIGSIAPYGFSTMEYKITEDANGKSLFAGNGQLMMEMSIPAQTETIETQKFGYHHQKTQKFKENQLKHKSYSKFTDDYMPKKSTQMKAIRKRKSASKLLFDVEWKNQNRNIIPNIMNQMFSFLEKKHKSEHLIIKLFNKYPHSEECTISKYFSYMKLIKSSMGHYINENQLQSITKIQDPKFSIYSQEQQLFYLKISRIGIQYFFMTESILISLTSNRMSHQKRKAHLIARRALFQRVSELFSEEDY